MTSTKELNSQDFKEFKGLLTEEEFKRALDQRGYDDDILNRAKFIKLLNDQSFFKISSSQDGLRKTGNMEKLFLDLLIKKDLTKNIWNPHIISRASRRFHSLFRSAVDYEDVEAAANVYEMTSKFPQTETTKEMLIEGYQIDGELIVNNDHLSICFDKKLIPCIMKVLSQFEFKRMNAIQLTTKSTYIVEYTLLSIREKHFLIMPLYPTTLEVVKELTGTNLERFCFQLFEALNTLHQSNFAHMDVKPSNICINNSGDFILIDLGSVAKFGTKSESTLAYIPSNYKIVNSCAQIDWIMLAATLSEKITGLKWGSINPTIQELASQLEAKLPLKIWNELKSKLNV